MKGPLIQAPKYRLHSLKAICMIIYVYDYFQVCVTMNNCTPGASGLKNNRKTPLHSEKIKKKFSEVTVRGRCNLFYSTLAKIFMP